MFHEVAKTTILIPVYNGMPYLKEAVESIFSQTQPIWNLIISDNCSTDGTTNYLSSLKDERISINRHSENIGAPKNFEYLYNLCQSEYACFLGSDDIMKPTFIERLESLISKSSDTAFVHSASDLIDLKGNRTGNYGQDLQLLTSKKDFIYKQWRINQVNITTCLFSIKKSKERGVLLDIRLSLLFDWALWFDVQTQFENSMYVDEVLCQYRQHANNTTSHTQNGPAWTLDRALIILERLRGTPSDFQPKNIRDIANRILFRAIKISVLTCNLKVMRQGLAALITHNSPRQILSAVFYSSDRHSL